MKLGERLGKVVLIQTNSHIGQCWYWLSNYEAAEKSFERAVTKAREAALLFDKQNELSQFCCVRSQYCLEALQFLEYMAERRGDLLEAAKRCQQIEWVLMSEPVDYNHIVWKPGSDKERIPLFVFPWLTKNWPVSGEYIARTQAQQADLMRRALSNNHNQSLATLTNREYQLCIDLSIALN